jgi:hypothetical protein
VLNLAITNCSDSINQMRRRDGTPGRRITEIVVRLFQTALNLYRSGKSNAAVAHFRYFIRPTSDVIIGDHHLLQPLTVLDDAERLFKELRYAIDFLSV